MRNLFPYYGIKKPERAELEKLFFAENGYPDLHNLEEVIRALWTLPQREYQYTAYSLLRKFTKKVSLEYVGFYEYLILTKSWWDTVDGISAEFLGIHFDRFPELIDEWTTKWMSSGNIWLQRSCILYQLKYKGKTDLNRLYSFIEELSFSNEFFIQKAIGWVLREYSKTDAGEVKKYVSKTQLKPLSKREALKWLNKKNNPM